MTVYGKIGIKVWICKGEVFGKRDLSPQCAGRGGKRSPWGERRKEADVEEINAKR
jgi:small subunit ribosomal protein S3